MAVQVVEMVEIASIQITMSRDGSEKWQNKTTRFTARVDNAKSFSSVQSGKISDIIKKLNGSPTSWWLLKNGGPLEKELHRCISATIFDAPNNYGGGNMFYNPTVNLRVVIEPKDTKRYKSQDVYMPGTRATGDIIALWHKMMDKYR